MGGVSCSTAKNPHIPKRRRRQKAALAPPSLTKGSNRQRSRMSLTIDAQVQLTDDFGQDTLMGLQELDSQLAIFEESADLSTGVLAATASDITMDIPVSVDDAKAMAQLEESDISRTFPKSDNAVLPSSTGAWSLKANGNLM
jgi:hypothetical protein